MSRMINNADISYSSINAGNFQQTRANNCCHNCFLKIPYATITSTLLVISGLIITFIASVHLLGIIDRFMQDLFYKHLHWLNEVRIVMLFVIGFISIIILINLFIGFVTSFLKFNGKPQHQSNSGCFCSRNSATNCIMRIVFIINQLIFIVFFILFIVFTLFIFILYLMKTICNSEQIYTDVADKSTSVDPQIIHQQPEMSINLQPFSQFFPLQSNETNLLIFKENRLKTLCKDYISTLLLYSLLSFLGIFLLFIGFYCYSINLTVNRIRIATYKKYNELLYLSNNYNNIMEMNQFNHDLSFDERNSGERF